MAADGRGCVRDLPAKQHAVSRTVSGLYPQYPENLPADAGDKHHVSNQGSVSGFRLQEEHLFPVCENAAGADRIHQAGESPHLFPGGNTARLRSAGRFRSVQNEGHVRSEPVGVLLLHGIILQPDAICVFQPGAISDTDGH